jgi:hypothetical protein
MLKISDKDDRGEEAFSPKKVPSQGRLAEKKFCPKIVAEKSPLPADE